MITKFLKILTISWNEVLSYRINFLLWRFRVVMQFLFIFAFWNIIFTGRQNVFGYSGAQIFSYIFLSSFLRSFVLGSRSGDVAGEILQGNLSNYLLRPISYFTYWYARDIADKLINLVLAIIEVAVLFIIFRPQLFIQGNTHYLGAFLLSAALAMILYFYFSLFISLLAFWIRDVWSIRFLTIIFIEFFSGASFPLDIFPKGFATVLQALPFSQLIYFPIKVYLGQLEVEQIIRSLIISFCWIIVFRVAVQFVWQKGLKTYSGEGR